MRCDFAPCRMNDGGYCRDCYIRINEKGECADRDIDPDKNKEESDNAPEA